MQIAPILSPDSVNYVNMLIQNIWNDEVATIGYYAVPPKDVTITFTVSGFAYDNEAAVEATEEPAPAPADAPVEEAESTSGLSPVVIVVIVVVVVAVVAVVAVVLAKKKKKN